MTLKQKIETYLTVIRDAETLDQAKREAELALRVLAKEK